MAKKDIRIRAKAKSGTVTVKALLKHPMETGLRKDKKTGQVIPAHFIQEVNCTHNGNNVLNALWGGAISKDPYLEFSFNGGNKGDTFALSWVDNQGNKDSAEVKIK